MKSTAVLAMILLLPIPLLPEGLAPASRYLGADVLARLSRGEDVRASAADGSTRLSLAPDHPAVAGMRTAMAAERPSLVVEAVFLLERPPAREAGPELLASYNILRSFSTLAGIQYYSVSRGGTRTLYESSAIIAGPLDRRPLPDRALERLPVSERLYALQRDTSFGENVYRVDFSSGADHISMESANETPLRVGIIPAADREAARVRLLVLETAEGIVFYAVSSARVTAFPGMRLRLEASFGNRAAALYAWFAGSFAPR